MEMRTFGKTGLQVSVLGFGGGPVGYLDTVKQDVADVVNAVLDGGINLIDTAAAYNGSEEAIGEAVGHRRDDYVLVSKCGKDPSGADWSASGIQQGIDRSLQRLRTDRLDVMLLHTCDLDTLKQGEALGALVKARDAGKCRFIGYSGDNDAVAYAAGHDDVDVIETSINICDQANIENVLPAGAQEQCWGPGQAAYRQRRVDGAVRAARDIYRLRQAVLPAPRGHGHFTGRPGVFRRLRCRMVRDCVAVYPCTSGSQHGDRWHDESSQRPTEP